MSWDKKESSDRIYNYIKYSINSNTAFKPNSSLDTKSWIIDKKNPIDYMLDLKLPVTTSNNVAQRYYYGHTSYITSIRST